ncbi:lamin tail domain-containing protein [Candidatus Uhrbacteria bacterium]|nr:lamin tail domain-containing protein [Candidatus Uhrbacteria bacterium]
MRAVGALLLVVGTVAVFVVLRIQDRGERAHVTGSSVSLNLVEEFVLADTGETIAPVSGENKKTLKREVQKPVPPPLAKVAPPLNEAALPLPPAPKQQTENLDVATNTPAQEPSVPQLPLEQNLQEPAPQPPLPPVQTSNAAPPSQSVAQPPQQESMPQPPLPPAPPQQATSSAPAPQPSAQPQDSSPQPAPQSPPVQASNVSHLLIGEVLFNAEGSDAGKEFVELYNPTDKEVSLVGWSLRLLKEGEEKTSSLASIGASEADKTVIPAYGFFLVGLNKYAGGADVVRSAALPNASGSLYLLDADGTAIDAAAYTGELTSEGSSLERRAWKDAACVPSQGSGENFGNGCDTGAYEDFENRAAPEPQSSQSAKEPTT